MNLTNIAITLLLHLTTLSAMAQMHEIVTDRPDQSNSPVLIPVQALQVETGFAIEKADSAGIFNYAYNCTLIKFGAGRNVELQLGFGYNGVRNMEKGEESENELSPASIGTKIRLTGEEKYSMKTAVIAHVNVTDFSDYAGADFTLAASHHALQNVSCTYNAGMKLTDGSSAPEWFYTVAAAIDLSPRASIFAECYGFLQKSQAADHRVDGGLTFAVAPLWQWDISAGAGLSRFSPPYFVGTGLSFRLFK